MSRVRELVLTPKTDLALFELMILVLCSFIKIYFHTIFSFIVPLPQLSSLIRYLCWKLLTLSNQLPVDAWRIKAAKMSLKVLHKISLLAKFWSIGTSKNVIDKVKIKNNVKHVNRNHEWCQSNTKCISRIK